jgi:putative iron-dependent peroxidase
MRSQSGILELPARSAHYVTLALVPDASPREILDRLRRLAVDASIVVGIGEPFARGLGASVPGLTTFPAMTGAAGAIPSTQAALWIHGRGDDSGDTLRVVRRAVAALGDGLRIEEDLAAFKHDIGRDLSGFEDGTENPKGDAAMRAVLAADGGSFVAVQRWIHDLARLESFAADARDAVIGRNRETNAELEDAAPTAHIKRAQQEAYDPPAFMVRRSMPYGTVTEHGLYFVAYVAALDTFGRVMRRMLGADDGIVDGLFEFSRPVSGGYYWCPPVAGGHLDLRGYFAST